MDPLTHGLTGALLAEAGFARRYGWQARLAMIGGAVAPDIDILWSPRESVFALETHRGITHSFLGGLAIALGVALIVRLLGGEKRWGPLVGMSYLGLLAGHLFVDLITPYGIQLFLPFSRARPAWDLVFIIDPFLTVPLLAALLLAWLRPTGHLLAARSGVVYLAAYLGFMAVTHAVAVRRVESTALAQGLAAVEVAALPQPFRPLERLALVETPQVIGRGVVRLWTTEPVSLERIPRGDRTRVAEQVEEHPAVRTYLWFARFPVLSIGQEDGRQVVEYQDLRFPSRAGGRPPFRLRVFLNGQGEVEEVRFGR